LEFGSPIVPILWEEKGGWGDEIDWTQRITQLSERTRRWSEVLAQLPPRLIADVNQETF
jgi:hypothetical protein